jgi:hypothetical protein
MGRRIEGLTIGTEAVKVIRIVRELPEGDYDGFGVNYIRGSHKYPETIREAFNLFKRVWQKRY